MRWLRGQRGRVLRRSIALLVVAALLALTHRFWLQAAGDLLVLREQPVSADAAVALGGDGHGGRALKGAELVRDGYAPKLYVLDEASCVKGYCVRWSELWRRGRRGQTADLEKVIPREAVVPLLDDMPGSPGTYEEA